MKYRDALAWLYGLQQFGVKLGLENIQRLIDELNVDLGETRVIHVAGTNGKGSVCAMIESIARAHGDRTGLYTSPHLISFRERIRVNGEMISEDETAARLTRISSLVSHWDPHPTFFEITTVLALQHFSMAKIDIAVLETGLGGRLDATNAVPSNVAVITPVDFDHQKWLGNTLEEIAGEKAGIIKKKIPVVSSPQLPVVEEVIRARAAECNAPVQFVQERYSQSPMVLHGTHQKENAAVALAALRAAKVTTDELAISRGLLAVEWPARFQRWDQFTFIDGAHNPVAARVLANTWRESFGGQRTTLILAVLADKDLRGICEALAPITDHVFLPRISSERAAEPQELAKILINLGARCQIGGTVAVVLEKARLRAAPILITGSLHFAGEALAHLQGQPYEECLQ